MLFRSGNLPFQKLQISRNFIFSCISTFIKLTLTCFYCNCHFCFEKLQKNCSILSFRVGLSRKEKKNLSHLSGAFLVIISKEVLGTTRENCHAYPGPHSPTVYYIIIFLINSWKVNTKHERLLSKNLRRLFNQQNVRRREYVTHLLVKLRILFEGEKNIKENKTIVHKMSFPSTTMKFVSVIPVFYALKA